MSFKGEERMGVTGRPFCSFDHLLSLTLICFQFY
jgi:hypothetical protein